VLISGADVLLQNQIPDVEFPLYHILIIVLLQGLLIFPHIDECGVAPFSSRMESSSLSSDWRSESKCDTVADLRYISGDSTTSAP
jgi:hypothetical protein